MLPIIRIPGMFPFPETKKTLSQKMADILVKGELFIHASALCHCVPGSKIYICVHTTSGKYAEAALVEVKAEDFQYGFLKLWDWYSSYFLAEVFLNRDREESAYNHAMDELLAFHQTPYMAPSLAASVSAHATTATRLRPNREKKGAVKRIREPSSGKGGNLLRKERTSQRIASTMLSDEQYTLIRNGLVRLIVSCFPSNVLATLPMDPLFKQISIFPMMEHGYVYLGNVGSARKPIIEHLLLFADKSRKT